MEIPVVLFFFVWALIGLIFLSLGFYTLDTTDLSKSVPLLVMSFKGFLQNLLYASTVLCLDRHELNIPWYTLWYHFSINVTGERIKSVVGIVVAKVKETKLANFIEFEFAVGLVGSILFQNFFGLTLTPFSEVVLFLYLAMHYPCTRGSRIESVVGALLPVCFPIPIRGARIESVVDIVVAKVKVKETKLVINFIEFAVGMVGSLLFQNFFRLTSFNEVLAFLYLAVAWLAILVLLEASYDFGVLNFLLGNVVVGCTVGQLGLQYKTWLMYAASLILYGSRLVLQSLTLVRRPNQPPPPLIGVQTSHHNYLIPRLTYQNNPS